MIAHVAIDGGGRRTPVDLSDHVAMVLDMHAAMRRDSDRLVRTLTDVDPADARRLSGIGRWYRGYLETIVHHHEVEDEVLWPATRARYPEFAAIEDQLVAEHHVLDDALAETTVALAAAAEHAPSPAACLRAAGAAEHEEMTAHAKKLVPLRSLAFLLPWVADSMAPEQVQQLEADAPRLLVLLYRLVWLPRYARLARHLAKGAVTAGA
jgi:hypothetical protein